MDVLDAAYRVAHDFPDRGAVGLAARLDKNPGTFLNELAAGCETAKLGLGTAVAMSLATGDPRILHAFADALGYVAVCRPDPAAEASDSALLDLFLSRDSLLGEFGLVVQQALADGRISAEEMGDIKRRAYAAVAAIFDIRARLQGLVDG